jgi:hypothetical protein
VVKAGVYWPDWSDDARRDYTNTLADILAGLLPDGVTGSISTVPLSYKVWVKDAAHVRRMVRLIVECLGHLAEIRRRTGNDVLLGIEPEPDCFIENTEETVAFFRGPLVEFGVPVLAKQANVPPAEAEKIIRHHLGVCVDVCHLAVEFEEPKTSLERLATAGVAVAKVQLSSALTCAATPAALQRLRAFCDPVYLHQVKVRTADTEVLSYADLPDALDAHAAEAAPDEEWRVHFHVPLYVAGYGELKSTSSVCTDGLSRALRSGLTEHLEIETYTFDVLPEGAREPDVVRSIAREYEWVLDYLR